MPLILPLLLSKSDTTLLGPGNRHSATHRSELFKTPSRNMNIQQPAFISTPCHLRRLAIPSYGAQPFLCPSQVSTRFRSRGLPHTTRMLFADPVNTMPEFLTHVIVSCGIGLAGIVGAKATEEVRALTSGDRRADYFDALARDVDSVRRRQELSSEAGNRDWNDVAVDRFSNLVVSPEEVPEIESYDDLRAFDRLLRDSPASKRSLRQSGSVSKLQPRLPDPSEFELEDDD